MHYHLRKKWKENTEMVISGGCCLRRVGHEGHWKMFCFSVGVICTCLKQYRKDERD